jgi:hypothetical protein
LADWENDTCAHPRLVWWAQLDRRFLVEVDRARGLPGRGELRIFDHQAGDRELLRERVPLAHDAAFGPDLADVVAWQVRAVRFVDHELAPSGPPAGPNGRKASP